MLYDFPLIGHSIKREKVTGHFKKSPHFKEIEMRRNGTWDMPSKGLKNKLKKELTNIWSDYTPYGKHKLTKREEDYLLL
jgi:hypothetical protein